jgi:hypothetical protein
MRPLSDRNYNNLRDLLSFSVILSFSTASLLADAVSLTQPVSEAAPNREKRMADGCGRSQSCATAFDDGAVQQHRRCNLLLT